MYEIVNNLYEINLFTCAPSGNNVAVQALFQLLYFILLL